MLAGELYDPLDAELAAARARARDLCQALNASGEHQQGERRRVLRELFGRGGDSVWMQPPFFCDYGANIELGERVFFNFNCVVLDVCRVSIGSFSLFGPAVQIYTPLHPMDAALRRKQEYGSRSRSAPTSGSAAAPSLSTSSPPAIRAGSFGKSSARRNFRTTKWRRTSLKNAWRLLTLSALLP
jgi:maltose O-acetyltransferase